MKDLQLEAPAFYLIVKKIFFSSDCQFIYYIYMYKYIIVPALVSQSKREIITFMILLTNKTSKKYWQLLKDYYMYNVKVSVI